ncbi:hypothetical protein ACFL1R_09580 [Candidatus Latescibacterota bacterium]
MKSKVFVMLFVFSTVFIHSGFCQAPTFKKPDEQRESEIKYDKLKILYKTEMQTDTSKKFITIPSDYPEVKDFDVAKTPPSIDFAVVQGLEPWYLPLRDDDRYGKPTWGGWGDVNKGQDDCFYFSLGNHTYIGANGYIFKYDPATKTQSIVLDLQKLIGWGPDEFGDSKLHGDLDIDPGGDMWMLSFFGPYTSEKYKEKEAYRGSYLIRYNIFSGETENLGIPLDGATWPYHSYDWERGLIFGVSHVIGYVIAYDTKARKMIYGGAPPDNIKWYNRCVLLDRDTGKIYASDSIMSNSGGNRTFGGSLHIVRWERKNNTFTRMESQMPENPVHGKRSALRAHTKRKDIDGAFWCFDYYGTIFKFYPEEDRIEVVGINWGDSGKYITNMCFSPKGRYIYYVADAATKGWRYGTPVIQYNTRTNRKKVIAFLNDFYLNKYGYSPGGTYGVELDKKGESLFFYVNGQFTTNEIGSGYGRPAIFHVHIPASERVE